MRIPIPLLLLALGATGSAWGDDSEVDPPARVARVSYVEGTVSLQAEGSSAAEPASLNQPITSGNRVLTDEHSRAELSLGTAAVRLDERADVSIKSLDDHVAQLQVNAGAVNIHLRELASGEVFEVGTPQHATRLLREGDYRIEVAQNGAARIAVREGNAEINLGNVMGAPPAAGAMLVRDQQQVRLAAPTSAAIPPPAAIQTLDGPDAFDTWSFERERQLAATDAEATRYVSREVVGYEDLDANGTWDSDPEYGEVWTPTTVAVGWEPYRFGRWAWVSPWGWTWIDNAAWGFAPFHYGRWAYARNRWCWVPGPRHIRPVYAPALVGWSGDRGAPYGQRYRERPRDWFPLAPREVYVPRHRASPGYLNNVNSTVTNRRDITDAYRGRGNFRSGGVNRELMRQPVQNEPAPNGSGRNGQVPDRPVQYRPSQERASQERPLQDRTLRDRTLQDRAAEAAAARERSSQDRPARERSSRDIATRPGRIPQPHSENQRPAPPPPVPRAAPAPAPPAAAPPPPRAAEPRQQPARPAERVNQPRRPREN